MNPGSETPETKVAQPKEKPADGSSEKRRIARTQTDQLLYLELGTGNGGIVLNVSEEGCGFLSIAPVWDDKPHFSFAIGGGRQIQGAGKVVWVDESKKLGGLRFVNTTRAFREQVRAWLAEPRVPESAQAKAGRETRQEPQTNAETEILAAKAPDSAEGSLRSKVEASVAVTSGSAAPEDMDSRIHTSSPVRTRSEENDDPATPNWKAESAAKTQSTPDSPARQRRTRLREEARALEQKRSALDASTRTFDQRWQASQEIHFTAAPSLQERVEELRIYLLGGGWKVVAAVAVAAGLGLSVLYYEHAGRALTRVGTSLTGRHAEKGQSSEAWSAAAELARKPEGKEAATDSSGSGDIGSQGELQTEASSSAQNAGDGEGGANAKVSAVQPVATEERTHAQGVLEQPQTEQPQTEPSVPAREPTTLAGSQEMPKQTAVANKGEPKRKRPHVTAEQIQALWSEVEAGDVSAEVHLGELYARGYGVPRSCGQARMLLSSAAKKGSEEAKQKLEELADAGCP